MNSAALAESRLATPVAMRAFSPRQLTPTRLHALPTTYVHPGQIHATSEGTLTTILGSCVAVCLHDPKHRIGGLNHFLLPHGSTTGENTGRYAPSAIALLVEAMLARGASAQRLVAHVVGGASVLAAFGDHAEHLGRKNAVAARDALAGYRIPIVGTDVGGTCGRKLVFSARDGATFIQLIGAGT